MSVRLSPCQRYSSRRGIATAPRAKHGKQMHIIAAVFSPDAYRALVFSKSTGGKGGSEELWLQAVRNSAPASINDRRQKDKRGETTPSLKLFTATQSYLTASFSALPETNAGTLAAAILISLPVCGLRPVRSARWFTLKVPKPTSCTASPSFRLSNCSQSGLQSSFSLGFGQFCFLCNYINQLSLVHKLSLQCVYRLLSIECDGNARIALSCIHAPIATFFAPQM